MHRAAASGMIHTPDAEAERIKARKARRKLAKSAIRALVSGTVEEASRTVTLYVKTTVQPPPPEECEQCLALQDRRRGRPSRVA